MSLSIGPKPKPIAPSPGSSAVDDGPLPIPKPLPPQLTDTGFTPSNGGIPIDLPPVTNPPTTPPQPQPGPKPPRMEEEDEGAPIKPIDPNLIDGEPSPRPQPNNDDADLWDLILGVGAAYV